MRYGNYEANKNGTRVRRAVDQVPASKMYLNKNTGFFHTDRFMLEAASASGDKSLFDALAQRLSLEVGNTNNGKTIQQLFDEWKPLYIQTASELEAWPAYLKMSSPDVYERLYGKEDKEIEASNNTPESTESNES